MALDACWAAILGSSGALIVDVLMVAVGIIHITSGIRYK
jgi:hypothetical protein